MASLILRPIASEGSVSSTMPSDTAVEDVYKLVNEEVADDGSTFFTLSTNSNNETAKMLCLRFSLPENIKLTSLTDITHYVCYKGDSNSTAYPAVYSTKENFEIEGTGYTSWELSVPLGGSWHNKVYYGHRTDNSSVDYILPDYEKMQNSFNNNDFCILFTTTAKVLGSVSQSYIELECEFEPLSKPFYAKQNGIWAEFSGTLYQKANVEWLEADVSVLSGEFPVEEV